jgi:hypothetical protein
MYVNPTVKHNNICIAQLVVQLGQLIAKKSERNNLKVGCLHESMQVMPCVMKSVGMGVFPLL